MIIIEKINMTFYQTEIILRHEDEPYGCYWRDGRGVDIRLQISVQSNIRVSSESMRTNIGIVTLEIEMKKFDVCQSLCIITDWHKVLDFPYICES